MNLPPPHPMPFVPVPSKESVSAQQVDTVLNILRDLQPYLLLTQRELDAGFPTAIDGGITSSAAVTFIKACDRLDAMLDDKGRWDTKQTDEFHAAITEHFKTSTKVGEKQIEAVNQLQRPARQLRPTLTTIGNEFIAFWGDATLPGGMILGRGRTPGLALEDFDKAFTREVGEQLRFAPASEERLKAPKRKKRKS